MNNDLLKLMKESIGEMDSKLGYSSQKLAKFFTEKFPVDYNRLMGLQPEEFTDKDILCRFGEILKGYNEYKSRMTIKQKLRFNSKELSFLFQFFRGPIKSKIENSISGAICYFYENFDTLKYDFSDDVEEHDQFAEKIYGSMSAEEFFAFAYEIFEYWNHLPSEYDSKITLYDYLLEPIDYSDILEWEDDLTDQELAKYVKSHYKGEFNKSQLRYLNNFYYGNEISKIRWYWVIYEDFIKYTYDPANEDLTIGAIDSKKFLRFVESVKKMGVRDFAGLFKLLAEICEQSQALNDDFKLFEEFLDDFASAEE